VRGYGAAGIGDGVAVIVGSGCVISCAVVVVISVGGFGDVVGGVGDSGGAVCVAGVCGVVGGGNGCGIGGVVGVAVGVDDGMCWC